jgi:hypothetical protein
MFDPTAKRTDTPKATDPRSLQYNGINQRIARTRRLGEVLFQAPGAWSDRDQKQKRIADKVLSRSKVMRGANFQKISRDDLELMAYLYDEMFLEGLALPIAESYGLSFRLSSRMTRAGGKTTRTIYPGSAGKPARVHFEIAISTSLLFQSFRPGDGAIRVCGYDCCDRLTAMQRIVEHELLHLCEMLVWNHSDCAANRFQSIARNMFRHTEFRHELVTQQERAAKQFNVKLGKRVAFRYQGKVLVGIVNRITRRATILVEDPRGERFENGKTYVKYYVPIQALKPIA